MDFKNVDINDRLNIAYDIFYDNNNEYQTGNYNTVEFKNIDNLKLTTNATNVKTIVNNIFNVEINLISSSNNKYIFERINGNHKSEIILSLYDDAYINELEDPDSLCNKNELIKLMLSEFLIDKKTNHIIISIINLDIPIEDLNIFFIKYEKLKSLSLLKKKIVKINIIENYFNKSSLKNALNYDLLKTWNVNDLNILIF